MLKKRSYMNVTKIVKTELDAPCRELSDGGLGRVVALTVCPAIDVVSFYWGSNPVV